MKKLLKEFQEFINRGNVMDMAIGVIIGGAFTAIVTSLTDNIINPLIKAICGGNVGEVSGLVVPGTEIDFGAFISAVINFLIVAAIVFAMVKALNKASGHVRTEVSRRMHIRKAPRFVFVKDEGAAYAAHINKLLGELDIEPDSDAE